MKKTYILLFSISLGSFYLLNSCATKNKKNEVDVKEISYPQEIKDKISNYPLMKFDLFLDTLFIQDTLKNHKKYLLSLEEVKFLASKMKKDENTESNNYYLNDYYSIEQAKLDEKYDEFVSKLDIGMMKDATCYSLARLEFGDSLALLIWKIEFSSYEACPYYEGTHFLGTLIADGKPIETMQIAANESSSDAPMQAITIEESKIFGNGKLAYTLESIVNEEDIEIEHIKNICEYSLSKKGFIKKNKKQKTSK